MNKQSFKRCIWLIDTIYQAEKEGITYEKICQKWRESELSRGRGYPLRTFHNHRQEIREVFSVNIKCRKSTNSYYIAEGHRSGGIMKKMLELIAINQMFDDYAGLEGRLALELRSGGESYVSQIMRAIKDQRRISIDYQPFWSEKIMTYSAVEPYAIKEFGGCLYLICKRVGANYEMVDLKHVLSITILEEAMEVPEETVVQTLLVENYGSKIEDIATEQITIKVDADLACKLRVNPIHPSQQELERKKGYSIFFYYLKPTADFCKEIFSFGPTMEVMNPESLRAQLVQYAKQVIRKNSI